MKGTFRRHRRAASDAGAGHGEHATSFLGSGLWHAEITTDGPAGLVRTRQVISAGDIIKVPAASGGGHVVKLTRAASVPSGQHKVTVAGSDHVLEVKWASVGDGAEIVRWPSNDGQNPRFAFESLNDGYVRIVNQGSGKAVVVHGASRDSGAKVIQYQYEAGANTNDEWLVEDAGIGRFRIANRFSGLYLTAGGTQGDQFEQRPLDGTGRQEFNIF